ncbi:MAG: RagB/SusD family nutrient uptake outer membrane protein [Saprospiraceae bacterium]
MTNLKIYTALLFLLFIMPACSDLLEEDALTFYSEDTVFSTESGAASAINGVYASLSDWNCYGSAFHNLIMPVSGKFFSTQRAALDATGLNTTPSNNSLTQMWEGFYQVINNANTVIKNVETSDLATRETLLGEAHFLRGLTYLNLVRMFGGVPLRTKPTTLENIHQGRASRQAVIDVVIADLEKAKELLPETPELGKPAKWAANVLLAKLYMTLAGEDGGKASFWASAKNELEPVINSGVYQLTPTYAELFEPGNENTRESIFEMQYDHTGGGRNSDIVRIYTPSKSIYTPDGTETFGRMRPNKETFDAHFNQYPEDPRLETTFIYGRYEKKTGGFQKVYPEKTNGNQGFALIRKWLDPAYNGTTTTRNYILLRYADVLLMMAEIENEINGPDAAYQYVNQVLTRARDMDGDGAANTEQPADFADMTQDEFRTRILKERQYELLSEGHVWFDTRRRGYDYFLNEVVQPHNDHPEFDPTTDFTYPTSEKNMLLPIPLTEISGNQMISVADQNPGY